ncbi:uncharacterized protein Z519_06303 [Cladophialophora bantiana CBS 173.52]|uniref:Protein kinase domain-containing protein n=1 Tax=Cladophialophora bantiana (strain ATCC 10958 / CBS 173.52 / CDC B-1940 / NIH 8579) TaxID=1442370 RepID=A0A0D2ERG3_CLAB1|nr:uncharacterized protein Z519_06303 [Cladophialophora bantiana CBS 173.52]KIW92456.1 hypothetical protein Z519_06303 [Cladophialophora bantiana CBS 173.52]
MAVPDLGSWIPNVRRVQNVSESFSTQSPRSFVFDKTNIHVEGLLTVKRLLKQAIVPFWDGQSLKQLLSGGIGAGSQATVASGWNSRDVLAPSPSQSPDVVIKRVRRSGEADAEYQQDLEAVLRELHVLCHSPLRNHRNVIQLLGYGWEDTIASPILIQERAEYGTLPQYLSRFFPFAVDAYTLDSYWMGALAICRDIATGLQALHASDIVHGDVKPENILVCLSEEKRKNQLDRTFFDLGAVKFEGNVDDLVTAKLSDFGLSLFDLENGGGQYQGTQLWNAPEVRRQTPWLSMEDLKKCDIFSYGLVVWASVNKGRYFQPAWMNNQPTDDEAKLQFIDEAEDDFLLQEGLKVIERFSDEPKPLFQKLLRQTLQSKSHLRGSIENIIDIMDEHIR